MTKKVLLIIIDAATSRILGPAIKSGRLPNLQRLQAAATLQRDSVAVFPSLTPAATTSLITGVYPSEHGIIGAYWYDADAHNVVNYGFDMWAILREGPAKFVDDFLVRLNHDFLEHETLFHWVERAGLRAASLNFLVFNGEQTHDVTYPLLVKVLAGTPPVPTMNGPSLLFFGDFIQSKLPDTGQPPDVPGGLLSRFAFSDDATSSLLIGLAERNLLPDFTVAYLPDNDFNSHEVGPEAAVEKLQATDEKLGEFFEACGGLDRLLEDVCIVLTGDHAQSDVDPDEETAAIQLDSLLEGFSIAALGTPMDSQDDLVVCPNLRAAPIYFHTPTPDRMQSVVDCLLTDNRIDQVIFESNLIDSDSSGFTIVTSDRGQLRFWAAGDEIDAAQDSYGGKWKWTGDLSVVDARLVDDVLRYGAYPNALERIASVQNSHCSGHLWVTARPGHEFQLENSELHVGGGSHGSLHILDSLSPLWVAGAPQGVDLPAQPRSVDVAPLCLSILGLQAERAVGASHIEPLAEKSEVIT